MLARIIGEDIELKLDFNGALGKIKVDPTQVEQVIMNLAANARDAMVHGGILTISTNNISVGHQHWPPVVAPGEYVLLQISDTGQGMDENIRQRIFEPFFTTKKSNGGTGLGLATVYGIIKQSEGYIFVDSAPGKGTSFSIYFPRIYEQVYAEDNSERPAEVERGDETILLIEDEEAVKNVISTSLRNLGYNVIAANDAEETFALLKKMENPPDLIITDVVLPGISGRKVVENILERFPKTRAIYISGYADDTIVHHGVLENGIPFLQKPFTTAALAQKVRELLDET
ncbi:MAG: ATP-binding protein [Spirochaetota bacterium]